ncbi:hypothetical protein TNCT_524251 [Trichonephila clavata]|uniref:Uncharacterized protein n=1 Tax=Trichonephila clavata TaxID=2740835 RepID=A0A8X6FT62_TRICU|nr:hypothetical protein TNCT_524251 [Trichonephila clavata]
MSENWGKRQVVQNGSEEDKIFGGTRASFPIGRATRLPLGGPVYSEACLRFICEFVRVESTTHNFSLYARRKHLSCLFPWPFLAVSPIPKGMGNQRRVF